jgi:sulfide dehydrogenase cytochrome subunit
MTNCAHDFTLSVFLSVIGGLIAVTASSAVSAVESSDVVQTEQLSEPDLMAHCTSCHGAQGDSSGPATPTIGGLSRNYLIGSLLSYKFAQDLDSADALVESDQDIEDVIVFARPSGVMNAVAEMLSLSDIKAIADFLSEQTPRSAKQITDVELAAEGASIHNRYCEKCHEDGGTSSLDDVGILAGRWRLYLTYVFEDLSAGNRQMPKTMATKFDAVRDDFGDAGFQRLIDYYSGQVIVKDGS